MTERRRGGFWTWLVGMLYCAAFAFGVAIYSGSGVAWGAGIGALALTAVIAPRAWSLLR